MFMKVFSSIRLFYVHCILTFSFFLHFSSLHIHPAPNRTATSIQLRKFSFKAIRFEKFLRIKFYILYTHSVLNNLPIFTQTVLHRYAFENIIFILYAAKIMYVNLKRIHFQCIVATNWNINKV